MSSLTAKLRPAVAVAACASLALVGAGTATAKPAADSNLPDNLVRQVDVGKVNRHLIAMQRIADSSGGSRAASTEGHARSAEYIATKLEAAGYDVTRQEFPFTYTETLAERLESGGTEFGIIIMSYSPSTPEGGITAPLAVIQPDDTPGCEVSDYGDVTGKIALIKRGACTFAQKQASAADAGAVGAVIYNNVEGDLNGTLGDPDAGRIPTGGITLAAGEELAAQDGAEVTLELRALLEERTSYNVIAQTKTGRADNVVMAGAHLDSVTEGPGINDNGSGSAALLETALQLGGKPRVNNAVRFAWWSAEEFGLVGSTHYVNSLSFEQQLDIALYLNFDMIGSPNAGYFVYDGDDSDGEGAGAGPYGSAQIEQAFVDYLDGAGVPTQGTDFSGRSDYGEFIAVGIPSGGLFTGAEGVKTQEQAQLWGGEAGVAYDPCYHQTCDNLGNIDRVALDRNADAMAWVTATYALSTEDVNGVAATAAKDRKQVAAQRANAQTMRAAAAEHGHAESA
ncbi:Zn-dependent M28 family amino/carboxypeptidase [Saccharomonospora amisosensis]|uniref:Zn-dependent M28 family amino/carboxypeptidase n=1 Tax=Saccharomonospora amisosensis TaxID=1128677 RepID=A0A7X5ZT38_9PSEU|nr:M28 family metallopeptidase [Saccharomonospora amisosensis]NIJ14604.1 Zn-dependent M28 family amino/carboxypeptidase [Saccharomonospora amisosensis]